MRTLDAAASSPQLRRPSAAAFFGRVSVVVIDFRKASAARRSGPDIIGRELRERRSMEQACADLRAKYEKQPTPQLARMIEQLQAEIGIRQGTR